MEVFAYIGWKLAQWSPATIASLVLAGGGPVDPADAEGFHPFSRNVAQYDAVLNLTAGLGFSEEEILAALVRAIDKLGEARPPEWGDSLPLPMSRSDY